MGKSYKEEFLKRKNKICAEEKVKMETDLIYDQALQTNRFDKRWYPECELATVTFENGQTVRITIKGAVRGELIDSNGTIYEDGKFKGPLHEVEDILVSDKDIKKVLSDSDDVFLDLREDNIVIACSDRGTAKLDDNIAKALFNVSAYRHLSEPLEQVTMDDVAKESEPAPEPEPEPAAEPEIPAEPEEQAEEPVPEPEPEPEEKVAEPEPEPEPKPEKKPVKKAGRKKAAKVDQDTNLESSGQFETFDSGAVRDTAEGKGRCDLLPLDVAGLFLDAPFFKRMQEFKDTGDPNVLIAAAKEFSKENFEDDATAILEWAVHMENGARKYGDNNWQKGIPLHRYVDSAIRHYLKFLRGDEDERHDRAVIWNCLCGAWTAIHHPDLNEYPEKK